MLLSNCPLCDSPKISEMKGTIERKIHSKVMQIPSVTYWFCPDCGEKIFPSDTMNDMEAYIRENTKQIVLSD